MTLAYVLISKIKENAAARPAGYVEEVLSHAIHRDAERILVDVDSREWIRLRHKYAVVRTEPKAARGNPASPAWGPKKWRAIHCYPRLWTGPEAAKMWFAAILDSLPNGGCGCQDHAREYVAKHPPDFSSPEGFFRWGVDFHNFVNALPHLQHPQVTHVQAAEMYGFRLAA